MNTTLAAAFLNYNTCAELLQALAHAGPALEGVNARLVVIDNGSTDDSAVQVHAKFPKAEVVELGANLGFAAAFNRLFDAVDASWYLLLNSDIMLPPGSVRRLLDTARSLPDLGLAGVALVRENGESQASYSSFPSLASELLNRSLWRHLHDHGSPTEPFAVDSVIGAVMLVPRSTIERVGGLDTRFFFYLEETDWCRRITAAGLRVMHIPALKVVHLQGRAANQRPLRARIEFHRSRLVYFRTHHGAMQTAVLCAGTVARLVINTLSHALLVALTLGCVPKLRTKCGVYAGLLAWYVCGCPKGWGLRPEKE